MVEGWAAKWEGCFSDMSLPRIQIDQVIFILLMFVLNTRSKSEMFIKLKMAAIVESTTMSQERRES